MSYRVFIAGHKGLVGSSIRRILTDMRRDDVVILTDDTLNLEDMCAVEQYFDATRPTHVILAAAKVGGIMANKMRPVEFLTRNISIQNNVLLSCVTFGVRRIIFLGSSCIYPKFCRQPMRENDLMTGPLETTNEAYAMAKLAGITLCKSITTQYTTLSSDGIPDIVCLMPCNLYGPGDKFDTETSHVIPSLIRKFTDARKYQQDEVIVWGTGTPLREVMYVDDLARAILMLLFDSTRAFRGEVLNVGSGEEYSIKEIVALVSEITGFTGRIQWDSTKPDGMPRKLMDCSKLLTYLPSWRPEYTLHYGLRQTVDDFNGT